MKTCLRAHPLTGYFVLAFGLSWIGIAISAAATGFSISAPSPLPTGLFFVAMLLGPSVGGLLMTGLVGGREALGDLRARFLVWDVGAAWMAAALCTAPLVLLAVLLALGAFATPDFAPHFQWPLLAVGLLAGAFEEIGWTGFATPRLLARQGVGGAGLRLGLVWAIWHALVVFLFTYGAMSASWILSFVIVYIGTLTPYRILMTWVYANTRSGLMAVLMHASYTGWLLVLFPSTSPLQSLIWQTLFATALWIAAALALWTTSRTPLNAAG